MREFPKVSVIIPCYNSAAFLRECLDSVVEQSLDALEVIAVNDGSSDETATIIKEYADRDSRIVFVDRENRGVGYSENEGIRLSRGEYIAFLDSDDYYHRDFLKNAYYGMGTGSDRRGDFIEDGNGGRQYVEVKHADEEHYGRVVAVNDENRRLFAFPNRVWTAIYRREFVLQNGIFWNEKVSSYNDNGFYLQTLVLAESILYLDIIATYYRRDNPASTVKDPDKMYANFFDEHQFVIDKYKEKGLFEQYRENLAERFYMNYSFALGMVPFERKYDLVLKASQSLNAMFAANGESGYNLARFSTGFGEAVSRLSCSPEAYYADYVAANYKVSITVYVCSSGVGYSEALLRRTLDSVVSQSLKGIEVIIVDDDSKGDGSETARRYACCDSRVVIAKREAGKREGGSKSAEALGAAMSHGAYRLFLNAGDCLDADALNLAYQKAKTENLDMVQCNAGGAPKYLIRAVGRK